MRGKGLDPFLDATEHRITPAYAGKSFRHVLDGSPWQDHPRLCGEKFDLFADLTNVLGSPPPMRGKGVPVSCPQTIFRITPAYAGKR